MLVKGGDWTVDRIVGADLVLARGGTVKSLPLRPRLLDHVDLVRRTQP